MSQTSIIFGALLIGFLVYITAKNQLGKYIGLFGIGAGASTTPAST